MFSLMKDYQALDPRYFKAFMAAVELENFTSAAVRTNMTQSGVSQHIAKLEEQIGLPLFKRIGKRVVVTETGQKLKNYIENQVYSLDTFLDSIYDNHERLAGLVSYAMPHSCLLSPHFPMLLAKRKPYSELTLNVTLTDSVDVTQMVLDSKIDFGFITYKTEHPLLKLQFFCEEEYILVGSDPNELSRLTPDSMLEHPYIMYSGSDIYYNYWLKHFCPDQDKLSIYSLKTSGHINSIDGAIKMVCGGLGIGVFPSHCVASQLEQGLIHEYSTAKKLTNPIYIVTLADHEYPVRVKQVIDWFFEMLSEY
jgi:LysR family transcriptional regulator, transcriptional activator of the cysJI operon